MNVIGYVAMVGVMAIPAMLLVMFSGDKNLALDCSKINL